MYKPQGHTSLAPYLIVADGRAQLAFIKAVFDAAPSLVVPAASSGVARAEDIIRAANLAPWATLAVFLFICFVAGFILDWISVLLIFIPVFIPIVKSMGFDPVWFCVLFLVVIQASYLTPPMAPAIFYLRGISPPEITLRHMFQGVIPFIAIQILCLVIVALFPQSVLWLPAQLLGFK